MELLKGTLLSNALDEQGRMPPARALVIARQMLVGLGRAHELGIVHRDVKPHNVMLVTVGGAAGSRRSSCSTSASPRTSAPR